MPFRNENTSLGLLRTAKFQHGRTNADNDQTVERSAGIPWSSDSAASYLYYECFVVTVLEPGSAVHRPLPQRDAKRAGTSVFNELGGIDITSPRLDQVTNLGVNLLPETSYDPLRDVVQRMARPQYSFRLWGQALRVGYKVPIPRLTIVGGVLATPHGKKPQQAFNRIVGNYSGAILWHAAWDLWYTIAQQPKNQFIPAIDPAAHISGTAVPPVLMQSPYSQADDSSAR